MKEGNATAATLVPYESGSGSTPLPSTPLMLEWPPEPKKYQRCGKVHIRPLILEGNAFEEARDNYGKYAGVNFWDDLLYYHHFGTVVSRPDLFAMAKPIEYGGQRGVFIQIAVGNILLLLRELLVQFPRLAFVAFCRNNDGDMRRVDWDYFVNKVVEMNIRKVA